MSTVVMQADSTSVILNGTPITDFAEGDVVEVNFLNDLTSRTNGSNGVNINKRIDCGVCDLVLRVQKKSKSDVFLNEMRNQHDLTVFDGSVKDDFVRDGQAAVESTTLEQGSFTTPIKTKSNNTDGDHMIEYVIQFRNGSRKI